MHAFATLSIRNKLALAMIAASGLALLLACTIFVAYEYRSFQRDTAREMESLADMIGANSTAALSFGDRDNAREVLASLRFQVSVDAAWLYDARGRIFAVYSRARREGDAGPAPRTGVRPPGSYHEADGLWVYKRIVLQGERVGTVVLFSRLLELRERIRAYVLAAVPIAMLSILAAFLLGRRLQRLVVDPLLDLSRLARNISSERDYSLRARKSGDDEIGMLVDGVNEMLGQIQAQDRALRAARDELEERVRERTRELEQEIGERTRAQEELARSNRELEQFAYAASHDLQEPLRKVRAFGDRLQSTCGEKLGERGRDYIARMQNAAGRMQVLITDLLTFSRVTTKVEPFAELDLNALVRAVVDDLEVTLAEAGGRVEVGELPVVYGDRTQIRQVFQNLIGNALKYRAPQRAPVVRIDARGLDAGMEPGPPPPSWWEVRLSDNGIGFEQRFAERIFEVFQRLHGRGRYEGSGVGLAVVRKIMLRHQGKVSADGEPGKGATFTLLFKAGELPEHD